MRSARDDSNVMKQPCVIATDSRGKLGHCVGQVNGEEAVVTSEAVIKKFHGSSVPRPRMKKQIPTKQPL